MEPEPEIDPKEAAEAKELAIRLALALLFLTLAYFGIADAFVPPA